VPTFPEESEAPSPNGRYVIVGENSDSEPHHTVFLEDRILNIRRKLFSYDSHIVLLWNLNSRVFAVTDFVGTYVGTDRGRCTIWSVEEKVPQIQVLDLIFGELADSGRKRIESILRNQHAYIAAYTWSGPMKIEVVVGAPDPRALLI
jgi:hypothetical protein